MKSYSSDSLCWPPASLQLRSHSYGYAPSLAPCTAHAEVASNSRYHMASYLIGQQADNWIQDIIPFGFSLDGMIVIYGFVGLLVSLSDNRDRGHSCPATIRQAAGTQFNQVDATELRLH